MRRGPAGAPLALLVTALLLLPSRLAGLQLADNGQIVETEETPDDGEVLPGLPSLTNDGTLEPDPTDGESCLRGRLLLIKGKRYSDNPARLANLRENCGPCFMNGHDAPVLFIKESNEGMGSRVQELLTAMAVASRNGMNFGGMVSRGVCHKAHGASVVRAARALFKLPHGNDIFTEEPPVFHAVYRGVQNLEESFARGSIRGADFQSGSNVLVQLCTGLVSSVRWTPLRPASLRLSLTNFLLLELDLQGLYSPERFLKEPVRLCLSFGSCCSSSWR